MPCVTKACARVSWLAPAKPATSTNANMNEARDL
jgi:hypothetical protein